MPDLGVGMGEGTLNRRRGVDLEDLQDESPPELKNPAPRLILDVEVLEKLTSPGELAETKCRV